MDNRSNIIAMMVLGAGIVALGATIVTGEYFHVERPEKMGYVVEGVEAEAGEGGEAAIVPIASLMGAADPAKGAEVFKKCASCHTPNQGGANGIGPNLWGVLGKPHGGTAGFAYTDALKGIQGAWNFDSMNAWLISPRKYAPGTKMTFAGLSKPEDRANVIAYLNSNGSNLPMPAAPAPGAVPAGGQPVVAGATPEADTTAPTKAGADPAAPTG